MEQHNPVPGSDGLTTNEWPEHVEERTAAYEKELQDSIKYIASQLDLAPVIHESNDSALLPTGFSLLNAISNFDRIERYNKCFAGNNPLSPFKMFVVSVEYSSRSGKHNYSREDIHFAGLLTLKNNYPYTIIRPETFADKLADMFMHAELDITEQIKFSDAFYMLTNDKEKLTHLLAGRNLDELAANKEWMIEIKEISAFFLRQ